MGEVVVGIKRLAPRFVATFTLLMLCLVITSCSQPDSGSGDTRATGMSLNLSFPDGFVVDRATGRIEPPSDRTSAVAPGYVTRVTIGVFGDALPGPFYMDVPLHTGEVGGILPPGPYLFTVEVDTDIGLVFTGETFVNLVSGPNGDIFIDLFVNAPPVIEFLDISDPSPPPGVPVTLFAGVFDPDFDDVITYVWGGVPGGGNAPEVTFVPLPGEQLYITLTVFDGNGGSDTRSITFGSLNQPPVIFSVVSDIAAPLIGDTMNLFCDAWDPEGGPLTYSWTGNDGFVAFGQWVQYTVTTATPVIFTCTATDELNLSTSATLGSTATGTSPVIIAPFAQTGITATTWTGSVAIDIAANGACMAKTSGGPTPAGFFEVNGNIGGQGSGAIFGMTANVAATCSITGLASGTAYDFYFAAQSTGATPLDMPATAIAATVVNATTVVDVTPPTTTAWTIGTPTTSSLTGNATINEIGTGYCATVPYLSAAPSVAQVIAGTGGGIVGTSANNTLIPATTQPCTVTGLTSGTAYDFYFAAKDAALNVSVATSFLINQSTTVVDVTPPVTTVALATSSTPTGQWTGTTTIDESGNLWCVAVPTTNVAPTAAQVKANAGGAIVGTGSGPIAMSAAISNTCSVIGLPTANYDIYMVAEDLAATPNMQSDATVITANNKVINVAIP